MPCAALAMSYSLCTPAGENPTFADSYFFEEVDKGLLSIGGRATYIDPFDASPKWYGGAQVRLHLGKIFAIEGSVDYREKKFDNTFTRTYSGPSVGIGLPSSRCRTQDLTCQTVSGQIKTSLSPDLLD